MPAILIGLGGLGVGTVRRVKNQLLENSATAGWVNKAIFFGGIDVQEDYDAELGDIDMYNDFNLNDPWSLIKSHEKDKNFQEWYHRGFNPPSSIRGKLAAGQIRLCGRLVYFKHAHGLRDFLDRIIRSSREAERLAATDATVKVFLVTSLGGGTGAGIFIDVAFLLRDLLLPQDKLYATILDGTVTELISRGTGKFGFGALVELEREMVRAREFKMEYERVAVDASRLPRNNVFDIVFLIQGKNMDGRTFMGRHKEVADDYKDLAAEFIYTVMAGVEFVEDIEGNRWNRFPNLPDYQNRSLKYAGIGISYISYPYKKIARYCYAKYFVENISLGFGTSFPDVESYKKLPLRINEADGSQFTEYIHSKCPSYKSLLEKKRTAVEELETSKNSAQFNDIYEKSGLSSVATSHWTKALESYASEVDRLLAELGRECQKEIRGFVGGDEKRQGCIRNLEFDKILSWLEELGGAVEKEIVYLDKNKRKDAEDKDRRRKELRERATRASEAPRLAFFGKTSYSVAKEDFVEQLSSWFTSEVIAVEYQKMNAFFSDLKISLRNIADSAAFLRERFLELKSQYTREMGAYTGREWILDPERFDKGEYILNLQVGISRKIIDDRIYDNIKSQLGGKSDSIKRDISTGIKKPDAGVNAKGIPDLFFDIHRIFASGNKPDLTALQGSKESYVQALESLFNQAIKGELERIVRSVKVEKALNWYFDDNYAEVMEAKRADDKEALGRLTRRFEFLLGDQASRALIYPELNKDAWIKTAIEMLFKKMDALTKPFVALDEESLGNIWDEAHVHEDIVNNLNLKRIYVPEGFEIAAMGEDYRNSHDDCRITFYRQAGGFPLLALNSLVRHYQAYSESEEAVAAALEKGRPLPISCHADVRFLREWKDNILEAKSVEEVLEDTVQLLIALGLGFGLISKIDGKAFYLIVDGAEKSRIAGTLPQLRKKIITDWAFRKDLQAVLYSKLEKLWIPDKKIESFQELFSRATDILENLRPKGAKETDEPTKIWRELLDKTSCKRIENQYLPKGKFPPRTKEDAENLIARLKSA